MVCITEVSVVAVTIVLKVLLQLSQGQEMDGIFHNASITHIEISFDSGEICPTWHLWNNETNKCVCKDVDAIVKCNPVTIEVDLVYGYCMTYDNNTGTTHVGKCFYTLFDRLNESWYTHLPINPLHLNEAICGQWSRRDYLCSQCREGYGLSVANLYMRCVQCSLSEGVGWLLFFLLQLIPVTIMFALIIVFRLSITQPPMNVFVLYSQLSLVIIYINAVRFQPPFLSSSTTSVFVTLRSIYLPVLSLWNLSFSHIMKLTNFCIHSNITLQHIYLLTYVTNIHIILLIVAAYICIELHTRNCRVIVWLWRPFHRCFARSSRAWNPRLTTVDTFATFLLLSHNRLIILSYFIFAFQYVYSLNEPLNSKIVLLYNPTVGYFDSHHLPYVLVSLTVLVTLVLTPAAILALYQTRLFASCLDCFKLNKLQSLHIFVELFHGFYKDGTSGTCDFRFTASIYLFLRLALLLAFTLCNCSNFLGCEVLTSLVLIAVTLLVIVLVQPYKNNTMNKIDALLLIMLVVMLALLCAVSKNRDTTVNAIVLSCVLVLVAIPQLVFYSFLVYKFLLGISKLHCSQRILKRCSICSNKADTKVELTSSQIGNSLLLELSEGRFDSSYEDSLSVTDLSSHTQTQIQH